MAVSIEDRPGTGERREEVKARLRDALIELTKERSFQELKIDDVARSAGLSRSAFYFYYRDKRDLLGESIAVLAEQLYAEADRWWRGEGEGVALIEQGITGVAQIWADNAQLLRAVLEVATYDTEVRSAWREVMDRFVEATAEQIRREQEAGNSDPGIDPVATSEILTWGGERLLYVFLTSGERPLEEVLDHLVSAWVRTIYGPSRASG